MFWLNFCYLPEFEFHFIFSNWRFIYICSKFGYISQNSCVMSFCFCISFVCSRKWLILPSVRSIHCNNELKLCLRSVQLQAIFIMWAKFLCLTNRGFSIASKTTYCDNVFCHVLFSLVSDKRIFGTASYLLLAVQQIPSPKVLIAIFKTNYVRAATY